MQYSPEIVAQLKNIKRQALTFEEFYKDKTNWYLYSTLPFKACFIIYYKIEPLPQIVRFYC